MEPLQAQPTNTDPQSSPSPKRSAGLATASLVVGIIALVIGILPVVGLAAGITAIILGVKALKASYAKGPSIAGIVTGSVGALMSLAATIIIVLIVAGSIVPGINNSSTQSDLSKEELIQQLEDSQKNFPKGETARLGTLEVTVDSVRRDIPTTGLFKYQAVENEFVHVRMTIKRVASINGNNSVNVTAFAITDRNSVELTDSIPFGPEQEDDLIYEELPVGESITRSIVLKIPRGIKDLDLVHKVSYVELRSGETLDADNLDSVSLDDFVSKEIVYRLGI